MAYIYKITNEITNQCYIGQTDLSIEKRFLEHSRASRLTKNKKRPLLCTPKSPHNKSLAI